MSNNDVPHWVDDAPMNWAPERPDRTTPPRPGPWSPPVLEARSERRADNRLGLASSGWLGRIGIGLAQGLFFTLLFTSRTAGIWPGAEPFLFDALALAMLFAPLLLLDGIGFVPLAWLVPFTLAASLPLAAMGWYHRWRILDAEQSHAGISLLVLTATLLFIAQTFLQARTRGPWRHAALFEAGWTLAARLMLWALAMGAGLMLLNAPFAPRTHLEQGDVFAMPLLGLIGALAFHGTAVFPRVTAALKDALVASLTIALPLACAAALFLISRTLAQGPAPLTLLGATMLMLTLGINASYRGGPGTDAPPRKVWRDSTEGFGALMLLILAGLAAWSLELRVTSFGWTTLRLFAAVAVAFFAAYGLGYSAAALAGLAGRRRGLEGVNIVLGLALMVSCLALASPLADPMRLSATAQAARLEDGRVSVEAFDFANLPRDSGRFGAEALGALARGPYADIAHAAALTSDAHPVSSAPNPTEVGANIAVRTLGARLPAALLARDWRGVAGIPACLTRASESCDAYFMDMDSDGGDEILLVSGSETRWWGAVMTSDAAGRWAMAGRIAAPACGPSLSDLRAGRFTLAPPLPGFKDMDIGGMRLSVVPSNAGCSHY